MKRNFLLIIIFIASSQIVTAQITKGDIFIGGAVSFGSSKTDYITPDAGYKTSNLSLSPAVGWVTKDNLVWGFDLPVLFIKDDQENPSMYDRRQLRVGAGVFARKYLDIAKNLYLFGQGRFGAQYIHDKYGYQLSDSEADGYQLDLSFAPGISYAIKRNIHLESSLSNLAYIHYSHLKGTTGKSSSFAIGAIGSGQTQFSVGLRFFLQRKA
jgi:hypothetical protein